LYADSDAAVTALCLQSGLCLQLLLVVKFTYYGGCFCFLFSDLFLVKYGFASVYVISLGSWTDFSLGS